MISVSMISHFISVFGFVLLTAAMKLVPLRPYGCNTFSVKAANACILSTVNPK